MNDYLKIPTPRFEMTEKSVMHYDETHKVHKVIANKKMETKISQQKLTMFGAASFKAQKLFINVKRGL